MAEAARNLEQKEREQGRLEFPNFKFSDDITGTMGQIKVPFDEPLRPYDEVYIVVKCKNVFTGYNFDETTQQHTLRPLTWKVVPEDCVEEVLDAVDGLEGD